MTTQSDALAALTAGILNGTIRVVDLTVPLEPATQLGEHCIVRLELIETHQL